MGLLDSTEPKFDSVTLSLRRLREAPLKIFLSAPCFLNFKQKRGKKSPTKQWNKQYTVKVEIVSLPAVKRVCPCARPLVIDPHFGGLGPLAVL